MSELHDDAWAQGWLAQAFNVLSMDALWTRQLKVDQMTTDEMHDTANFGESMLSAWRHLIDENALKQVAQYVRERNRFAVEHASELAHWESDPTALTEQVYRVAAQLRRASHHEAAELERKIELLRSSEWTPGDLSTDTRCAVLFLAAAVTLAIGLPHIAAPLWAWFLASQCRDIILGLGPGGE